MKKRVLAITVALTLMLSVVGVAVADFTPISKGDRGDAVKEVQQMLKDYGYLSGSVDGIFGNDTYGAVSAFQQANGLEVTGVVGEATYNALLAYNQPPEQEADNDGVSPEVAPTAAAPALATNPAAVILESDCDLEITEAGFTVSDGYLYYGLILHNNSQDKAIQIPSFRITARGSDNSILGTTDNICMLIYPGQDVAMGGMAFDVSTTPGTVEFEVIDPDEYFIVDVSQLEHPEYIPLVIENTNARKESYGGTSFVGEVSNPNDYDIDMASVVVLLKNESGEILGGEMTYVNNVKAGRSTPFEINSMTNVDFSGYEIYASQG